MKGSKGSILILIAVFMLSGCIPFPSRYKLWKTYISSKPGFKPAASRVAGASNKVFILNYIKSDFEPKLNIALIKKGFIITPEKEADFTISLEDVTKKPIDLPGFLPVFNNNVYVSWSLEAELFDRVSNEKFTKKYVIVCRDSFMRQIEGEGCGCCGFQIETANRLAQDMKNFAENKSF